LRTLIFILIGAVLGVAVGYTLAPRMHAPHLGKEELLRQRAVQYYAASRRLDRLAMFRLSTPARQLTQTTKM
jgi:hypothetical protein